MKLFISLMLIMSFSGVALAGDDTEICKRLHRLIKLDKEHTEENKYPAEFKDHRVGFIQVSDSDKTVLYQLFKEVYQHLDIDGDGKDDFVQRNCGSGVDMVCIIDIKLTTGKSFTGYFSASYLTRLNHKVFIIEKFRSIYFITKEGIKPICKK